MNCFKYAVLVRLMVSLFISFFLCLGFFPLYCTSMFCLEFNFFRIFLHCSPHCRRFIKKVFLYSFRYINAENLISAKWTCWVLRYAPVFVVVICRSFSYGSKKRDDAGCGKVGALLQQAQPLPLTLGGPIFILRAVVAARWSKVSALNTTTAEMITMRSVDRQMEFKMLTLKTSNIITPRYTVRNT